MKHKFKNIFAAVLITAITINTAGCNSPAISRINEENSDYDEKMQIAQTTPFGKYPETITYRLGKMTSTNNSNMHEGDTYENNAYTRYIKNTINVQNLDVFEENDKQYDTNVSMAVAMNNIPDIMIVGDYDELMNLVENDLIEDLTDSYKNCVSPRIKDMYSSYGNSLMDMVSFNGKIMALPETNITDGPNLIWLRKDWMDKLELSEPKNLSDVENIVSEFVKNDMDGNGQNDTVGLVCDTSVAGECGYSSEYLLDTIFACYGAFPKQWIKGEDGKVVYGSVTDEAGKALEHINSLYESGILDSDFLLRTSSNIIELIEEGKCGSFFGPWWAPNNPLITAVQNNPAADWEPYLISTDDSGTTIYHSQNPCYKYVVVRKGYEHPEIAAKMISVMFDKIRYECEESGEFADYFSRNVEPTARPLSINVDYNNALDICYRELTDTIDGKKDSKELELLEKSYYDSCISYIEKTNYGTDADSIEKTNYGSEATPTPDEWAAYTSRIKACSLLSNGKIKKKESLYFGTTKTMKEEWWKMKEFEKEAYIKIICGEESIDYFKEFVDTWYKMGGDKITREVSEAVAGRG